MNKIYLITLFVLCYFYSCKPESKHNEKGVYKKIKKELKAESNSVVILGETDDKSVFEYLNILDYSEFFAGRSNYKKEYNLNNSNSIQLDSIMNPKIIELMMFGENNKFYNTRLFITPGDTINILIKDGKLRFKGTNSEQHNFYLELDSLNNQWSKNGYEGNINDYKAKSLTLEAKREEFFKNYIEKHHEVSKEFINQVQSELKFEYLYNLVAPRSIKIEGTNIYVNNLQGVISTLESESNLVDGELINFDKYFDNIKIEDFNKPELINNDYYKRSLVQLIRHYFTNQEYVDYTEENFKTELNFIKSNLVGETAKYATGRLIYDYYKKGFGQDKITKAILRQAIEGLQKQKLKPSYKEVMDDVESKLEVVNVTIPKTILDEKLIDINNDTLTLGRLIANNNKIKLLNFWAFEDRCKPCVYGIKASKTLKYKLNKKNDLKWIYISIENKKDKWLKDINKLESFMQGSEQYRIADDMMSSKILKYFRIRDNQIIELPRYTLIHYDGTVLLNNAPRPNDSIAFYKAFNKIIQ
jgi:hypothetical protein